MIAATVIGCGSESESPPSFSEIPGWVAVVVGVSEYADGGVPDLGYSAADALSMADVLERNGWRVITLTDARATKTAIMAAIAENTAACERFLFYYSGHGTSDGSMGFICPHDTEYDQSAGWLRRETLISGDELRGRLSQNSNADVAAIFDSCYSGSMKNGEDALQVAGLSSSLAVKRIPFRMGDKSVPIGPRKGLNLKGTMRSSLTMLTACGEDEIAVESSALGHSVFSFSLLGELSDRSNDADQDGCVGVEEGYEAVKDWLGSRYSQVPRLYDGNPNTGYRVTTL